MHVTEKQLMEFIEGEANELMSKAVLVHLRTCLPCAVRAEGLLDDADEVDNYLAMLDADVSPPALQTLRKRSRRRRASLAASLTLLLVAGSAAASVLPTTRAAVARWISGPPPAPSPEHNPQGVEFTATARLDVRFSASGSPTRITLERIPGSVVRLEAEGTSVRFVLGRETVHVEGLDETSTVRLAAPGVVEDLRVWVGDRQAFRGSVASAVPEVGASADLDLGRPE